MREPNFFDNLIEALQVRELLAAVRDFKNSTNIFLYSKHITGLGDLTLVNAQKMNQIMEENMMLKEQIKSQTLEIARYHFETIEITEDEQI